MTTIRQQAIAKKVSKKVGKGRKISLSQEMRKAGYSEAYSRNPQRLKKSKGWSELMEEYLPDEFLLKQHKRLFGATLLKSIVCNAKDSKVSLKKALEDAGFEVLNIVKVNNSRKVANIIVPNDSARDNALEKAYKLKNRYKHLPSKDDAVYNNMTDEEIAAELEIIAKYRAVQVELRKKKGKGAKRGAVDKSS